MFKGYFTVPSQPADGSHGYWNSSPVETVTSSIELIAQLYYDASKLALN